MQAERYFLIESSIRANRLSGSSLSMSCNHVSVEMSKCTYFKLGLKPYIWGQKIFGLYFVSIF